MRSGAAFCGPGRVGDEAGARERVVARHVLEARAVEDGVSEVWHARHVERSSRRATIRIIRPSRDTHLAPAVNAFLSDARAASGLVHRNIVRAYEIGDVEQPFVLGPHTPAVSWAAHVHGGIGAADAIVLLVPLAAALDAAAAAGAAHGAVHPCSILVDNGRWALGGTAGAAHRVRSGPPVVGRGRAPGRLPVPRRLPVRGAGAAAWCDADRTQ